MYPLAVACRSRSEQRLAQLFYFVMGERMESNSAIQSPVINTVSSVIMHVHVCLVSFSSCEVLNKYYESMCFISFTDEDQHDMINMCPNIDSEVCTYVYTFESTINAAYLSMQDPVNEQDTEVILSSHERFNFVSVLTSITETTVVQLDIRTAAKPDHSFYGVIFG